MAAKDKQYSEKQLSGMAINPTVSGSIIEAYPHLVDLLRDSEVSRTVDADKFVRYIALVYDPQSPLIVQSPDLKTRKKRASEITGFSVLQEHSLTVVLFLQRVLRCRDWTVIVTKEQMFDEFTEKVNEPSKGDDDESVLKAVERKIKLIAEMEKIALALPAMYKAFFSDDSELEKVAIRRPRSPEERALS